MDYLKKELENIDSDKLSPANKLKKKHLIRLADICGKVRIADSHNLKLVYDIFKHPPVKF